MDKFKELFEKSKEPLSFDGIRIKLASPEKILSWSFGEVKKPETINYRTFKPERDGLFCGKIFGPVKDWECICGKYKRMKYKGVVCEKCGVEVTLSKVRRERMGHIELASPVAHIWFFKGLPSRIGNILDLSIRELERVIYFENYIVTDLGDTPLKSERLLTEERYRKLREIYGDRFKADMGAEAIYELLKKVDMENLSKELKEELKSITTVQTRRKFIKRLKIVEAFRKSGNKPEWMILKVIPVIPPELRPLVPLEGGRFATSDLNDLYRRVINRNNRLKRLMELNAPEIIIRNEKRMLQEAVSALFDNGRRGKALRGTNKRPLKSLSDMLKGKQGRFRQNLLGKRVDYSGRTVVVVGPELKFHQCGFPKKMALELFKPFIFHMLEKKGYATTIKSAKKMVEKESPEVWEVLDEVIKDHPILLNRAPTLHRLGIQAFEPVLIEGKAIRIHPLVCAAFNADFDGDQMAVHIPLSMEAQIEARVLMLSTNNILSPANGKPIAVPSQDIILGCYYMTKVKGGARGENKVFSNVYEVRSAYDAGELDLQAKIRVRINGELVSTTTGRVLLYEIVPPEIPLLKINNLMNKKTLSDLISESYLKAGREKTAEFLDKLKELGFRYATKAGISISINDMRIPITKEKLVGEGRKEVLKVEKQYRNGLITNGERYNKIIDIWAHVNEQIADEMFRDLESEDKKIMEGVADKDTDFNAIYIMADSGARGSSQQIRQLAGMRGLMAKPSGEIIETPITANFKEGLTVLQYFISTHGARKGLADTALKTANSGYLTRRLVDVAQDVIIKEEDCKTIKGIEVEALIESGEIVQPLNERILGRITLEDILDPFTEEVIVKANEEIDEEAVEKIENTGIEKVKIRSVLICESHEGVCAMCYGRNLATGELVTMGEAVGIIAAQSIGEPGTQLTMRTFHIGGTASRVVEQTTLQTKKGGTAKYFDIRTVINKDGDIVVMNRNGSIVIQDEQGREKERYKVVYGAKLKVKDGQRVPEGHTLVEWDPYTMSILTEVSGKIAFGDIIEGVTVQEKTDEVTGLVQRVIMEHREEKLQPRISIKDIKDQKKTIGRYLLPAGAHIAVSEGEAVSAGDIIAKIPRETTKTKDITGGLPRVAELFEARRPHEKAIIAEINGVIKLGGFVQGKRVVTIIGDDGEKRDYLIPRGKHVSVHDGDRVKAGEPLMDGVVDPHDILNVLGVEELQKYLVNEVQEVYRLQGVQINDKHIEIIVRQMMKHLIIEDAGDTDFLVGEQIPKNVFMRKNEEVISEGGRPAKGRPTLLGITKSSLSTESFISAASFQETTRVLTEVAVSSKVDYLKGLKENVIMGRLIPAGTGVRKYRNINIETEKQIENEKKEVAEMKLVSTE
ncbi:MAG: DNA-directed RNA polymerase subunit beta' [Nitrospinae bacterium RIFCSPLOWO2_02_FULL_39_110]|nr:MAG: DNA-directed RNA polymerase subunit beta' [Nitrospinae bacterium RIFCSPHIGHO2_02_39_11]OGV98237.1 MAG: DNA-directed RNA polymerase subunit beta' [Nitrospinae bacterium RIFCSPHIGHO2_12_FULL_39_42]OGW00261.1 MAG: DNA-directed RNA polymerase subunit beta' [Nitrospinae bacterium RIFCSPHIGHO2_02_FULL_39_82]OGW04223.1 MAG: DNA-directed RNA polymerase subunit beta' [Nitrospinae bacterium RIFCSPLOWO2_02_FULL_39_110]OGW09396.1 MAG: DNA-directed RNA polymerase subunit beta' [Nitrospinae bacterium